MGLYFLFNEIVLSNPVDWFLGLRQKALKTNNEAKKFKFK